MARNEDHYAVVIGLSRYPKLGEPPPSDLKGPVNDASRVREWLIDPDGGGLPEGNVETVITPEPFPEAGAPERDEIQRKFRDLADRAEAKRLRVGALLGRRLYVYVSGHGFSPMVNQGCLHAGDAGGIATGTNVYITAWLERLQDAGYFFETVLWMDCCMNRESREEPSLPTIRKMVSPSPPGPSFSAVAARRPLSAVEQERPDGTYGGVFTTVLLEGLRGAAANPYGMVTGRSLADWIRNAQRSRLSATDLADPRVSKEPDVFREDQGLVFARGVAPMTFPVTFKLAGGKGKAWRLWKGRPPAALEGSATASRFQLELTPGLYVIEVEALGLRQGFEVTGPAEITIDQPGPPVRIESNLVPITINPDDPMAEVYLVDQAFQLVDKDIGRLSTSVPPGIYKTRIRSGDRLAEQVYLLDAPPPAAETVPSLPAFEAAAPLPQTAFTHEYHEGALGDALDRVDLSPGAGSQILLMTRMWREKDARHKRLPASAALQLWGPNGRIADLRTEGRRSNWRDPYAMVLIDVDPGLYYIRREAGGSTVEQCLVALEGQRSSFFFLVTPDSRQPEESAQPRSGLLMHPIGTPFDPVQDKLILQAQSAIGKSRPALTRELEELLLDAPPSPLAELLGAHLLILEQAKRPSLKVERLPHLVQRLRQSFAAVASGDVDALALAASPPDDPAINQIGAPPMLKASWDIIAEASVRQPRLIPTDLYDRIFASAPGATFNAWAIDPETREATRRRLAETFAGERQSREAERAQQMATMMTDMQVTLQPDRYAIDAVTLAEGDLPQVAMGLPRAPITAASPGLPEDTAEKLRALGLPASVLDL